MDWVYLTKGVMISVLITCAIFALIDVLMNKEFIRWWATNKLWIKIEHYSCVLDSDGEVGIEILDGYALTLTISDTHVVPLLWIVSVPEIGSANHSHNSYWSGRGFNPKFPHGSLQSHDIFDKLRPSQYMMRKLHSLYEYDLRQIQDMSNL